MNKQEILSIIETLREKSKGNLVTGEYKDGFLDGLGLLWIDINYDEEIK